MRAWYSDIEHGEAKAKGRSRLCVLAIAIVLCSSLFAAWLQKPWPKWKSFVWKTQDEFSLCILLWSIAPEEKTDASERRRASLF